MPTLPTAPLAAGSPYHVTVLDQPSGQYCTVSNASGTVAGSAVTNANVNCVNTYSVGGTLAGLTVTMSSGLAFVP